MLPLLLAVARRYWPAALLCVIIAGALHRVWNFAPDTPGFAIEHDQLRNGRLFVTAVLLLPLLAAAPILWLGKHWRSVLRWLLAPLRSWAGLGQTPGGSSDDTKPPTST